MQVLARAAAPDDATVVPLACVPGAIPAGGRAAHFALLERLFTQRVRERRDLPDGRAFRFDAELPAPPSSLTA